MRQLILSLIAAFSLTSAHSFGQDFGQTNSEIKKNTLFLEGGGNALLYSFNFDRLLKIKEKWRLSGRLGIIYFYSFFSSFDRHFIGLPVEFSYLRGHKNNFLELGIGVTPIYDHYPPTRELISMAVIRIGYRYQKREGGIFYKFGFTPLAGAIIDCNEDRSTRYEFEYLEKFGYPLIGAAIGWTLKK